MKKTSFWLAAAVLVFSTPAKAQDRWQIHEWGTFTSLQDESGHSLGGINTDDEPVPRFVHGAHLAIQPDGEVPQIGGKGFPFCHPDVTMRLETPVIYFHPPAGGADGQSADVKVKFRGGWLTEFYPNAVSDTPGQTNSIVQFVRLTSDTVGNLEWDNVQIGGDWPLVDTSAHVWTSPRDVQAALVHAAGGESEKFLFYRGVGHLDAPLRISSDADTGELLFHSQLENLPADKQLMIHSLWLVDIQLDGKIAFRTLPPIWLDSDSGKIITHTPATFAPEDSSAANFLKLKDSLKAALMSEGLFDDEAQALLKTWEVSYFKSPGLRVFFLVPRAWTDYYLPLQISLPAQINRVMVGRIELVTPDQRKILRQLAGLSTDTIDRQAKQWSKSHTSAASVPESYQLYLDLGRFRNALILDEEKLRPTSGLADFITWYHLQPTQPIQNPQGS